MASPGRVVICFSSPDPSSERASERAGEADRQAVASLAAGFTREGLTVEEKSGTDAVSAQAELDDLVILIWASGSADPVPALVALRERLGAPVTPEHGQPPVIVIGDAERREAALAAGANAFIAKPAFVKDVVTLGRILRMPRDGFEPGWGGELDGLHLYYIVRALGAALKTGVLGLFRNGRRGELRFFEGEVTSAQVGLLHGQAALHQLLLWPEASFDLRAESVVRRQQIPLTPKELLVDAERFLRDFSELTGGVSPASRFEQDLVKAAENVDKIPKEVQPIVRLFDGERTIADVIEESPLRLTETMKVTGRLIGLGVLRKLAARRPHRDAAAALLVEDWVVGQAAPVAGQDRPRRRKGDTPAQGATAIGDWGSLGVVAAWEAASYAPVVPSQTATGEISVGAAGAAPRTAAGSTSGLLVVPGGSAVEGVESKNVGTNGKTRSTGPALAVAIKTKPEEERVAGVAEPPPKKNRKPSGELKPAAAPPPIPIAAAVPPVVETPARVQDRHFEDHEQAFFDQEHQIAAAHAAAPPSESFADLDEGRPRLSFWKRLFHKGADSESAHKSKVRRKSSSHPVQPITKKPKR